MENKNNMQAYTDKYFLRSNEILKAEGMNPWVNMQVFVRAGPGKVGGIEEAIDLIKDNSNIEAVGGRIYAKAEGQSYESGETLMNIVAPIQEIMELETVYLGVMSAGTTRANGVQDLDYAAIGKQVRDVVALAGNKPVQYFGARHWHYNEDAKISKVAFDNGCVGSSTDNGAATVGKKGQGTIPHATENVMAYYYGAENAVKEATLAFDRVIDPSVPRVALVDYNNKEIDDTLATIDALEGRLDAVRVDTCGENLAQGATPGNEKYVQGTGVTTTGVAALRYAMNTHPLGKEVEIIVTSGFSNPDKVEAFNRESTNGVDLYNGIGAGFLDGIRTATADIIAIGESAGEVDFYQGNIVRKNVIHKIGRPPKLNNTLEQVL